MKNCKTCYYCEEPDKDHLELWCSSEDCDVCAVNDYEYWWGAEETDDTCN